jgi:hypothetical protein
VSPAEGQLLRLRPPCFLVIGGDLVEVVRRTFRACDKEHMLMYDCRTRAEEAQLIIHRGSVPAILWHCRGVLRRLHENDIDVYTPGGRGDVRDG